LTPHWFLKGGSGCCGLWTTPSDLARFAIEIQQIISGEKKRILTPQMGRTMLTPTNSEIMGLGFRITQLDDETYFQHSGGNPPGFSCLLYAHRAKGYGIAVMTNASRGGLLCRELLQAVAHTYQWDGYKTDTYKSFAQMIETYRKLKKENPKDMRISETRLNSLGYRMLSSATAGEALKIFKLNCDFYPHSANCYDSLGDAYVALKDHKNALASFRKVLKILDQFPDENKDHQRLREVSGKKIKDIQQASQ
jgi:tetratricopeptide (TPR) repeat protein